MGFDALIWSKLKKKADLVGGKIPQEQLPSYIDDVVEYKNVSKFPKVGESGKIYIDTDNNQSYRWSGSTYVTIGGGEATQGPQGVTFTPSINADGDLSWSNDGGLTNPTTVNLKGPEGPKGDKGDKGDQGIQGEQGPRGEQGLQGEAGVGIKDINSGSTPVGVHEINIETTDGQFLSWAWNSPHIGYNGNWWLGETDLDIPPRGDKGDKGDKGDTGNGIVKVEKTATSGLTDTYTITFTNGTTTTFTMENGQKGDQGDKGDKGDKGDQGDPGYTPVKGTDYFTEAEIQTIVDRVVAQLSSTEE